MPPGFRFTGEGAIQGVTEQWDGVDGVVDGTDGDTELVGGGDDTVVPAGQGEYPRPAARVERPGVVALLGWYAVSFPLVVAGAAVAAGVVGAAAAGNVTGRRMGVRVGFGVTVLAPPSPVGPAVPVSVTGPIAAGKSAGT